MRRVVIAWEAFKETYTKFPLRTLFVAILLWVIVSSLIIVLLSLKFEEFFFRFETIIRRVLVFLGVGVIVGYLAIFIGEFFRIWESLKSLHFPAPEPRPSQRPSPKPIRTTSPSSQPKRSPKTSQESVVTIETVKRKKRKKNPQPQRKKEVKVKFIDPPEPKGLLIHEDEVNNVDLKVWDVEYNLKKNFKNIVGQEVAKRLLLSVVPKAYGDFKDGKRKKPVSFLLVGVTGVGKTETVKQVAKALKSRGYDFFRIDANQVKDKEQVNSFFGSARGYVGSDTVPLFVRKAVESEGKLVILIDEVEKAHPEFIQAFMGILDEGEFTYNTTGERVRLDKAFVFFTSNALAGELVRKLASLSPLKQLLFAKEELQKVPHFPPEILGRIDYVVPFLPLTEAEYKEIISRHYERVFGKRASKETVDKLFDYFVKTGVIKRGVREIVRTIELLKEFPEEVEV